MSFFESLQNLFHVLGGKGKSKKKSEENGKLAEFPSPVKPDPSRQKPTKRESRSELQGEPEKNAPPPPRIVSKKRKNKSASAKKVRNRTGIPILKKDADLEQMMRETRILPDGDTQKLSPHFKRKKRHFSEKKVVTGRNRHGIPILKDEIDFSLAFAANGAESEPEESFAALLEKSLGSKELDVLLHEKKQKPPPSPLSLKERIARYPAPEETLDLHGFSGIQASLKTEVFLEGARAKGVFTVRIVTGKGLHSDGPAILPGIVEQKILELRKKDVILAHKWENKSGKPHGSVQVFLKHFK